MKKVIAVIAVLILLLFMAQKFLFKKDHERYMEQGKEYFSENRYKDALFYFEEAEKFGSTDALKYSGVIYLEYGDPKQAIPKFEKYLKTLKPDSEDNKIILNDLAVAYYRINEIPKATKYFKMAADLGNTSSADNLKKLNK